MRKCFEEDFRIAIDKSAQMGQLIVKVSASVRSAISLYTLAELLG